MSRGRALRVAADSVQIDSLQQHEMHMIAGQTFGLDHVRLGGCSGGLPAGRGFRRDPSPDYKCRFEPRDSRGSVARSEVTIDNRDDLCASA